MFLCVIDAADGKEGFDTTMQSLSTSLLLHRISRVDLEGHPLSSPLRRATSPPIQQTETTDLPRKPTFDVSEQDQYHDQEELVGPGRNGLIPPGVARNPVLVLHECLPAASSAYSSLLGAVAGVIGPLRKTHSRLTFSYILYNCFVSFAQILGVIAFILWMGTRTLRGEMYTCHFD